MMLKKFLSFLIVLHENDLKDYALEINESDERRHNIKGRLEFMFGTRQRLFHMREALRSLKRIFNVRRRQTRHEMCFMLIRLISIRSLIAIDYYDATLSTTMATALVDQIARNDMKSFKQIVKFQ